MTIAAPLDVSAIRTPSELRLTSTSRRKTPAAGNSFEADISEEYTAPSLSSQSTTGFCSSLNKIWKSKAVFLMITVSNALDLPSSEWRERNVKRLSVVKSLRLMIEIFCLTEVIPSICSVESLIATRQEQNLRRKN